MPLREKVGADSRDDGITYTLHTDGTMCIFDGSRARGEVVIPETIDGYPVTCIGKEAFLNEQFLTEVYLPSTETMLIHSKSD